MKRIRNYIVSLVPAVALGAGGMMVAAGQPAWLAATLGGAIACAVALASIRVAAFTGATEAPVAEARPDAPPRLASIIGDKRRPIVDRESGLYVDWYFRLRVEEEIARAERFGQRFSVVSLPTFDVEGQPTSQTVSGGLREVDYAGDLVETIAVVLPNTDAQGARIWSERRLQGRFLPEQIRISEFPADGNTSSQMLGEMPWAA